MRIRRLVRVAGYLTTSRTGSVVHAVRRRAAPERWTRRDPYRIVWVAPSAVRATTAQRIDERERGRIIGGDWDVDALAVRDLTLWRGLEQRLLEGRPWAETDLAPGRHVPEAPNVGRRSLELDPAAQLERCLGLDALALALRRDGWLSHHDVGATFRREMAVAVGRDGRLIRNSGGLHRLVIAQLIGLERIPCRILVEHAELAATRTDAA